MKIALLLAVTLSSSAAAQLTPGVTIAPGTEVRLTLVSPSQRLTGRFQRASPDSVYLVRNAVTAAYPFANVRRVQVRGGEDKRKGFLIGGAIFGGITLVAGGIDYANGRISGDDYAGTLLVNFLIGGAVGYAFAPKGWIDLPLVP